MVYRSAILGCGPRAACHIEAYLGIEEIKLVALCDMNEQRLQDYGSRFEVAGRYTDLEKMLAVEHPDILHVVTPPAIREQPIAAAANAGVKGVIVEKPLALSYRQVQHIQASVAKSGLKIVVNMQRRYFGSCQKLKEVLCSGRVGDIQFVRGVTRGNILSMGPHIFDLLLYLLDDAAPIDVWAAAYGMNGYDYGHPAPANMLVQLTFPDSITAYIEDSADALGTPGEPEFWQHLELDFWGTEGRAWWTQNRDWGYQRHGMDQPCLEKTSWFEDDIPGQRGLTRAMARWLDDDSHVHLNCLDNALLGFDVIMGAMQSAYAHRRLTLPAEVPDDIVAKLEHRTG